MCGIYPGNLVDRVVPCGRFADGRLSIAAEIVGKPYAHQIETLSLEIYQNASAYAAERGIIIADTKFEFGLDEFTTPPSVVLIDEVLTPDSSRFWSAETYAVGRSQESFDKQYLRGEIHLELSSHQISR